MKVLYTDVIDIPKSRPRNAPAPGESASTSCSDRATYVTLHVPLDSRTRRMIDRVRPSLKMKPGAVLINTCRGPVTDEDAVLEALESKRLFGYAADVYTIEPPPSNHPLIGRTDLNLILTPHSAAQSVESLTNMAVEVATDVVGVLQGKPPINPVNDPVEVASRPGQAGQAAAFLI